MAKNGTLLTSHMLIWGICSSPDSHSNIKTDIWTAEDTALDSPPNVL